MKKPALLIALLACSNILFAQQNEPLPGDTTKTIELDGLVVSASRLSEDISKSPVTIERMSRREIFNSASPSFYDALGNLKGVQMLIPSIGFKVINTRGFGNTTNVRFVQMVDGMDIQAIPLMIQ